MYVEITRGRGEGSYGRERTMSAEQTDLADGDAPLMQQLYNRIWLLAAAAMVFFIVVYVGWGLLDITSVPVR